MRFVSKWSLAFQCSAVWNGRYTRKVRRAIFCACEEAIRELCNEVTPEHLLLGLLQADQSLGSRLGLSTIDRVRNELTKMRHERRTASSGLALSEGARSVVLMAREEREHFVHRHTGTEHLLLGVLRSASVAATMLERRGLTVDRVHQLIRQQSLIIEWRELSGVKAQRPSLTKSQAIPVSECFYEKVIKVKPTWRLSLFFSSDIAVARWRGELWRALPVRARSS